MKAILKEFREFVLRGNVIDMAVGIIVGASFGKIVSSLVNDVLMPPLGLVLGSVDFSNIYINLSGKSFESLSAAKTAGAPTINIGLFLNNVFDFTIVAFALFFTIKQINILRAQKKKDEPTPAESVPTKKQCPYCFFDIPVKAVKCGHCGSEMKI
jgi:large conductance mechanosensitive channel